MGGRAIGHALPYGENLMGWITWQPSVDLDKGVMRYFARVKRSNGGVVMFQIHVGHLDISQAKFDIANWARGVLLQAISRDAVVI